MMGESFEWVEIIEPSRGEQMFANLKTGQCLWEPPKGVAVKPTHENQWWELYDMNTRRYYYYNAASQKTVWHRPKEGDIIPLAKLQMLKAKETKRSTLIETKIIDSEQSVEQTSEAELKETTDHSEEIMKENIYMNADVIKQNNKTKLSEPLQQKETTDHSEEITKENIYMNSDVIKQNNKTKLSEPLQKEQTKNIIYEVRYENVNIEKPNSNEKCVTENSENDDDNYSIDVNKVHSNSGALFDNSNVYRSSSLPRSNFSASLVNKPNCSSLRNKAPPKPPRVGGNTINYNVEQVNSDKLKISVEKSNVRKSTENLSTTTSDGCQVTVQSSARMKQRTLDQPTRKPSSVPLPVEQAMEFAKDSSPPVSSKPTKPSSPPPTSIKPTSPSSPPGGTIFMKTSESTSPNQHHDASKPTRSPTQVVVPEAPPPPSLPENVHRRATLSVYDNVRSNTISMYDNVSDGEELEDSSSMSTSRSYDLSASSDEALTPSGTLLRNEISQNETSSLYERLDEISANSQSPRFEPLKSDADKTPPAKRSPLTRMKSDTSDVEKRAKFFKSEISSNAAFRPVSMLNLSSTLSKPRRQLGSESDIPEQVPLSTHRIGFLRKRMSIHSMLSWSKTPIKKPMVLTRDKQKRKEAVEVFKLMLQCMGDRSSRKTADTLFVEITTKGWNTPLLRDEIYIQLCKQTTGNEKATSLKRGWELITACLSMFPPSNKFHSYLEGYIYRHLDGEENNTQVPVESYAKHCYKQLERICQTGAKRGLKGPTVDEIHSAIKRVFNPSMFGNTLEDIMEMQQSRFPNNRLPWILTTLTEAVLLQNGFKTEGIFRIPGDIDEVNSLKLEIDKWLPPKHVKDPNIPASLLKLWFRDLYSPLIPQQFYDQCIHNCDNQEVCLNIVNSLDPLHNLCFTYLIRLLQAFMMPDHAAASKMDENNLAMVWAPNCLRCPSNDPREIFENTRKEMAFLKTIMTCLDTSFLEGVV